MYKLIHISNTLILIFVMLAPLTLLGKTSSSEQQKAKRSIENSIYYEKNKNTKIDKVPPHVIDILHNRALAKYPGNYVKQGEMYKRELAQYKNQALKSNKTHRKKNLTRKPPTSETAIDYRKIYKKRIEAAEKNKLGHDANTARRQASKNFWYEKQTLMRQEAQRKSQYQNSVMSENDIRQLRKKRLEEASKGKLGNEAFLARKYADEEFEKERKLILKRNKQIKNNQKISK
ncbi:MAG: hypothetical protein COZ46_02950 [Verrucomicrobia bacterium CG_4_10_14_3_um_filter_43_23]|nr:MAG: hypothetical protein AUJ82_01015 [Verrucomicrobia bacterium CG1_02_43_26]PIP59477.1 MAG: hypothetical protein COX01_02575 [Verrucomicrobia bacterium CG22_combo_CG10-13_8_21_14_all_43_17]PIX58638.1 MAG: hypothetical protein COZ46_02950 [Verrucomicrobia bacterium CG_4_10_14_3_um_filter_43_23]PIY61463.1 MAG: hypothetical protein COY94_05315 [Verrucomicrobia bacterium CG_4_10_14_0_8_um_filter_43_34]PJA43830.1 MAG: hypothetical protein CO175_06235 [Verrucomicrobia bacterium CG_4_9_14_3_um_fi